MDVVLVSDTGVIANDAFHHHGLARIELRWRSPTQPACTQPLRWRKDQPHQHLAHILAQGRAPANHRGGLLRRRGSVPRRRARQWRAPFSEEAYKKSIDLSCGSEAGQRAGADEHSSDVGRHLSGWLHRRRRQDRHRQGLRQISMRLVPIRIPTSAKFERISESRPRYELR